MAACKSLEMDLESIDVENSILILSILDRIKHSASARVYYFNFKGFYKGVKIASIEVSSNTSEMLVKGEAYLALVTEVKVCDGKLKGRLLKYELVFK